MKQKIFYIVTFLILGLPFISCETSDDGAMENTEINITDLKATVTSGTWVVVLFEEEGLDETTDFSGFSFLFNADGVLRADSDDNSISGAWSITSDDDDLKDDVDFNIFFSSPANFTELSEDWDIVSFSETRIELKDVSDDDSTVDRLILEKQ